MTRYEAGETLSSIGRTYDCSPPAISYVVSRSRARCPAASSQTVVSPAIPAEPQLIKSHLSGSAAPNGSPRVPAHSEAAGPTEAPARNGYTVQPSTNPDSSERHRDATWSQAEGHSEQNAGTVFAPARHPALSPAPAPTRLSAGHGNGDHRAKLHLSRGNGSPPGNGAPATGETHPVASGPVERSTQPNHQPYPAHRLGRSDSHADANRGGVKAASDYARAAPPAGGSSNGHSARPAHHDRNGAGKEGTGAFINSELRARVEADIAAFLAAFEAALVEDTQENRSG